jgi:helix-turn-helix protein
MNKEIRTTLKQEFIDDIQDRLINKEKLNIVSIRKLQRVLTY